MKYYSHGSIGYRPNFIVQFPDNSGEDRSIGVQFDDTTLKLVHLPRCKVKGFWRIKWKGPNLK